MAHVIYELRLSKNLRACLRSYRNITAMTKVIAGSMLLIAQEKVGEVNFNPA